MMFSPERKYTCYKNSLECFSMLDSLAIGTYGNEGLTEGDVQKMGVLNALIEQWLESEDAEQTEEILERILQLGIPVDDYVDKAIQAMRFERTEGMIYLPRY